MKLRLRTVPALSSREEVFLEPPTKRRSKRRPTAARQLRSYRVPELPPRSAEHQALAAIRAQLDLSDRAAASALGIRVGELLALERGELQPMAPEVWPDALEALRVAAANPKLRRR